MSEEEIFNISLARLLDPRQILDFEELSFWRQTLFPTLDDDTTRHHIGVAIRLLDDIHDDEIVDKEAREIAGNRFQRERYLAVAAERYYLETASLRDVRKIAELAERSGLPEETAKQALTALADKVEHNLLLPEPLTDAVAEDEHHEDDLFPLQRGVSRDGHLQLIVTNFKALEEFGRDFPDVTDHPAL